jgi:hypothetical protein
VAVATVVHSHTQFCSETKHVARALFSSLAALPPSRGNGTCVLQELSVSPQHLIHLAKLLFQDKTPQQSNEAKMNFANAVASVVANENIYENANTHKLLKTRGDAILK